MMRTKDRFIRFKLQELLLALFGLSLLLGCIVHVARMRHRQEYYRLQAARYANLERVERNSARKLLGTAHWAKNSKEEFERRSAFLAPVGGKQLSDLELKILTHYREMQAGMMETEGLARAAAERVSDKAEHFAQLRREYERAVARPWVTLSDETLSSSLPRGDK